MMVEDKCGAKTWTPVSGKWKEHSCIKRRPVTESTHKELNFSDEEKHMKWQMLHLCDCSYKWPVEGQKEQPWKKNLPSKEEVQRQMADLIGV